MQGGFTKASNWGLRVFWSIGE